MHIFVFEGLKKPKNPIIKLHITESTTNQKNNQTKKKQKTNKLKKKHKKNKK